jgi:hypothetical protein
VETEGWLNWNVDIDNRNNSEEDCAPHVESNIEQYNVFNNPECQEQRNVRAKPDVLALIRPRRKLYRQATNVFVKVNAIDTRTITELKKIQNEIHQDFSSFFV